MTSICFGLAFSLFAMWTFNNPSLNSAFPLTESAPRWSMSSGFAGIDNPLFVDPKTVMLFGDAKESVAKLAAVVKAL